MAQQSRYIMAIDPAKCTSCMACVMACKLNNQVETGQNRNWVRSGASDNAKSGLAFQPGACMHCADPLCVKACPTKATYLAADGSIQVDNSICIACSSCVTACPYDARYINKIARRVDKCDYCRTSLTPLGLEPACVSICPTRARIFGDAEEIGSPIQAALAAHELSYVESKETPTNPTLAYLTPPEDKSWPRKAEIPAPVALMAPVATVSRWLGGLALFGVIGVFLRQLAAPTEKGGDDHE